MVRTLVPSKSPAMWRFWNTIRRIIRAWRSVGRDSAGMVWRFLRIGGEQMSETGGLVRVTLAVLAFPMGGVAKRTIMMLALCAASPAMADQSCYEFDSRGLYGLSNACRMDEADREMQERARQIQESTERRFERTMRILDERARESRNINSIQDLRRTAKEISDAAAELREHDAELPIRMWETSHR
jgi:hypothetical protein